MTVTEYTERALRSLGHELETMCCMDFKIPGRIRNNVRFLDIWDNRRINRSLIKKAEGFRPDMLIVFGADNIHTETVLEIKKRFGTVTVNIIADFPLCFYRHIENGPHYDHCFISGTDGLSEYRKAGNANGYWLPFACDPDIHKPVVLTSSEKEKYGCDICFVGSKYSERVPILESLTGFDLKIWGLGWERLDKSSPLKRCIKGGILRPEEWVKAYSACKIALPLLPLRADVDQPFALSLKEEDFRMCNTRIFEILGCGAFQIAEKKADALELFRDKEEMVFYDHHDLAGLADLVRHYLDKPEERKRICENARRSALEKHTYRHRMEEMLSVIYKGRR